MSVNVVLDAAAALAELQQLEAKSQKAMERTMKDIKSRGPSWVAKGVTKTYNLSSANVKNLSTLRVKGSGLGDLEFKYTGRMLTPTHFRMSPTAPKDGAYKIKATILKGRRATIGSVKKVTKKQRKNIGRNFQRKGTRNSPQSPPMLMRTGKAGTANIPFQRTTQPGHFDTAIKTVSVPQMIQDGKGNTKPAVREQLNINIEKRFNHHIENIL